MQLIELHTGYAKHDKDGMEATSTYLLGLHTYTNIQLALQLQNFSYEPWASDIITLACQSQADTSNASYSRPLLMLLAGATKRTLRTTTQPEPRVIKLPMHANCGPTNQLPLF